MSAAPGPVAIRDGSAGDADAVAALHAASWRAHYRGAASDPYLDGQVGAERRAFWRGRLAAAGPGCVLLLAEAGDRLAGFACALPGRDPGAGTLIDNLHVAAGFQRNGLGRALLRGVAARLRGDAARRPVHLFVLEANEAARAFYARLGGEVVGRESHALPDGTGVEHPVLRYAWASPRDLMADAPEPAR